MREPPSLKVRTLKMSKEQLFISLGKWANDWLKNRSLLLKPSFLRRNEGFFAMVKPLSSFDVFFLHRGEVLLYCGEPLRYSEG